MINLREIKGRLRSIRKNQQILSAMKMVSAVKLRRIQAVAQESRPYAERLASLVRSLLDMPEVAALQHPLLLQRRVRRALWVVLATDRGLCGSLNANVFRYVRQALLENGAQSTPVLWLIGRKACDHFKRPQTALETNFRIEQAYPLEEARAESIARQAAELYRRGRVDRVDLFYARCKSTLRQVPDRVSLLPVAAGARDEAGAHCRDCLFEPPPAEMAGELLPRYLASCVRQILIAEQVSEHSARMIMMGQASKNASDMIGRIQMDYNKLRQGMITRELADITTGVEAMA